MTNSSLQAALRAGAEGLYALEAGTGLLIAHGYWAGRGTSARSSAPATASPAPAPSWPRSAGKPRSALSMPTNYPAPAGRNEC